jgi:hypothetical protein
MKNILICCLLLFIYSLNAQAEDEDWVYTTRPGDTLWDISKTYLKGTEYWSKLQKYNDIKNPKLLPPGARLLIPVLWLKQQPTPAIVVAVSGTAKVKIPNESIPVPLKIGMKLYIQSEITTSNAATAVLKFADDSRLVIQQNSFVKLNILTAYGANGMVDTRMRLQHGRVESKVVPFKNKDSRYEITTPAAVASVRGTKFRVNVDPITATMHSEVVEGEVVVASQGVTQIIPAGFGTKVEKGKAPMAPQQLLPAADLSTLQSTFYSPDIRFSWLPIAKAVSYHVEIAHNTSFHDIVFNKIISTEKLYWVAQSIGDFSLRIRGINKSGSEGLDAIHNFSIYKDIQPPKLVAPRNNTQIFKDNFALQWLGHADAKRFHLQISTNPNFDKTVIESSGNQQYYSVKKKLPPGKYYWRVANEYAKGIHSNYSEVFQFKLSTNP